MLKQKKNVTLPPLLTPKSTSQTVRRGNNESFMLSAQVVREFHTEAADLTLEGCLSELRPLQPPGEARRPQSRTVWEREVKSCKQGSTSAVPIPPASELFVTITVGLAPGEGGEVRTLYPGYI